MMRVLYIYEIPSCFWFFFSALHADRHGIIWMRKSFGNTLLSDDCVARVHMIFVYFFFCVFQYFVVVVILFIYSYWINYTLTTIQQKPVQTG